MALCGIKQLVRALLYRVRIGWNAETRIRRRRSRRELELLNFYANALNDEGDESAAYQGAWYLE
jgi:hypothetical protein